MNKSIILAELLFEVSDIFGKRIRTTIRWWEYIVSHKHKEIGNKLDKVKEAISLPHEVRQSDKKSYIYLYYKKYKNYWVCVVVRHLNGEGFLMTAYITTKIKRKGLQIWPNQKKI